MTHLENSLNLLKEEVKNMWELVGSQLNKARTSFLSFDKNLAREVMHIERRVNALELKIDRDCEDILALHTPVAIDLRLIIATLKINSNLERIGDFAEGIAKHVLHSEKPFDSELVKSTKVIEMYDAAIDMFNDALVAFENEDTLLARTVFGRDEFLDDINSQVNVLIAEYLKNFPSNLDQALYDLSIIRKLERVGDHTKNIAEEIIFYIDAKVIKHSNKKTLL
jgi:phosphate transport system protein